MLEWLRLLSERAAVTYTTTYSSPFGKQWRETVRAGRVVTLTLSLPSSLF